MLVKTTRASILVLSATAGVLLAAAGPGPARAEDRPLRLAMHDMMPMPTQSGSGGSMSGGMMGDNMMPMPQSQPGQMGGMPPPAQSGPMGGGMQMDDNMRMQQQGQSGQMGRGTQPQRSMGQGGSMGQGNMPGQMGGMMDDSMMRMMNDHMRMMMGGGMRMGGGGAGMAMGPSMVDMTDRIEGRLAFLRAELHVTDAQNSAWTTFAEGVRSSRQHLLEARQQLNQPSSKPADRLEQYERHLAARLEALKSARTAFTQLYASLDEAQKRTADELVVPFIATF